MVNGIIHKLVQKCYFWVYIKFPNSAKAWTKTHDHVPKWPDSGLVG